MKKILSFLSLMLVFILAACSQNSQVNTGSVSVQPTQAVQPAEANQPPAPTAQQPAASSKDETRTDSQGAVEVAVMPVNLDQPGDSLEFEVGLNTHSVDLSMDLASLSTLSTDSGLSVQGSNWDAQRGGHHVGGTLSFPASVDGKPILAGAKTLTLTIKSVDAAQRTFSWDLP